MPNLDPRLPLEIERAIAAAHRATWRAALGAESWQDQGLADDLHAIAEELRRVQEAMLKRASGQFSRARRRA
jgi:hypothetical protein